MNQDVKDILNIIYGEAYNTLNNKEREKLFKNLYKALRNDDTSPDWMKEGLGNVKSLTNSFKFKDLDSTVNGKYNHKTHKLTLNRRNLDKPKDLCHALIHEIVHAYQNLHPDIYFINADNNIRLKTLNKNISNLIINDIHNNDYMMKDNEKYNLNSIYYDLSKYEREAEWYAFDYLKGYDTVELTIYASINAFCKYYNISVPKSETEKECVLTFLDECYKNIIKNNDPQTDLEATIMYDIEMLSAYEHNLINEQKFNSYMNIFTKLEKLRSKNFRIYTQNNEPLDIFNTRYKDDYKNSSIVDKIEYYTNLKDLAKKEDVKLVIDLLKQIIQKPNIVDKSQREKLLKSIPNTELFKQKYLSECISPFYSPNENLLNYFFIPQEVANINYIYNVTRHLEYIPSNKDINHEQKNVTLSDVIPVRESNNGKQNAQTKSNPNTTLTDKKSRLYNEYASLGRPESTINKEFLKRYVDARNLLNVKNNKPLNIFLTNYEVNDDIFSKCNKLFPDENNIPFTLHLGNYYDINEMLMFADRIIIPDLKPKDLEEIIKLGHSINQEILTYKLNKQELSLILPNKENRYNNITQKSPSINKTLTHDISTYTSIIL